MTPDAGAQSDYIKRMPETGGAGVRYMESSRSGSVGFNLQILELVIFAALAAVVLFQLYAVLGRKVGRQPEDAEAEPPPAPKPELDVRRPEEALPMTGLQALQAEDPSFGPAHFLSGAKGAYEIIVRAYAAGDRETLRSLVSPSVYQTFDTAISSREAEGRTGSAEFLHPPRADLESAEMVGRMAKVRVRFLAEVRNRSKGPEGEAVDDQRTAELWTFERSLDSRDPNWALARVDAAEA